MAEAPFISTFIAFALIPVAFLFIHAYISGRKRKSFHKVTGTVGIIWDLSISVFYMLFRLFGGEVEGTSLEFDAIMIAYFAIHGLIAVVVIILEITMLVTGFIQWRKKKQMRIHSRLSSYLLILWFAAFLSGEFIYLANYIL